MQSAQSVSSCLLAATTAAFRAFAAEYGGQYDFRNPVFPLLRFAHPAIGEAHVMRHFPPREATGKWSFGWQDHDFERGRRSTAGGFRRSSGVPGDTMAELLLLMCEITVLDPSMLVDDVDEIANSWRQQMAPERKVELRAFSALCYPRVDFARLLARAGSPRPVPGAEWEFHHIVFADGACKLVPAVVRIAPETPGDRWRI